MWMLGWKGRELGWTNPPLATAWAMLAGDIWLRGLIWSRAEGWGSRVAVDREVAALLALDLLLLPPKRLEIENLASSDEDGDSFMTIPVVPLELPLTLRSLLLVT